MVLFAPRFLSSPPTPRRTSALPFAVALLFVLACGAPEPRFPTYTPYDGNPDLLSSEDVAVYDTILPALQQIFEQPPAPPAPPGQHAKTPKPPAGKPVVLLQPSTVRGAGANAQPAAGRWRDLADRPIPGPGVPRSAVLDFQRRNAQRASLTRFRSQAARIIWTERAPSMGTVLYSLTLPGYSSSGDEALVEVSVADSPMSGGGQLVYLRRVGKVWRVIAKQGTWIS
jgi:hypothetical protein